MRSIVPLLLIAAVPGGARADALQSGDAEAPPAAIAEPTRAELDSLAEELALLELANTRRVQVPPGISTLRELLDALQAQAGIDIDVDWEGLVRAGVEPDGEPPITRGEGSLLAVLEACCTALGTTTDRPRAEASLGRVRLVSSSGAATLRRTRAYQADSIAEELVSLATDHIDPENWVGNGGEVQRLSRVGGTVLVSAPASIHRRMAQLLDELRATRPAGVSFVVDILRIPGEAFRLHMLEQSSAEDHAPDASIESIRGAERIAAPALVAALDTDAVAKIERGGSTLTVRLRPSRAEDGSTVATYEVTIDRGEDSTQVTGTLPLPLSGPPATIAAEDPLSDTVFVLRLRGRPLLRAGFGHATGPSSP